MPSTQHTQACVFKKKELCKIGTCCLQLLEIDDQDREPGLGSQI